MNAHGGNPLVCYISNRESTDKISTAMYQHRLGRLRVMVRGALVSLIYHKLQETLGDHDPSQPITHMSTDTDSVSGSAELFHELWGQSLDFVIGLVLLSRALGWLWVTPVVLILCKPMGHTTLFFLFSREKSSNLMGSI